MSFLYEVFGIRASGFGAPRSPESKPDADGVQPA